MISKLFAFLGCFLAMLSVIFGAFGAHALKTRLTENLLNAFEVGVRYQMYHGLALLGIAALLLRYTSLLLVYSGWGFFLGTLIFSGSLYILSLTGIKAWGAVTPIGGVILVLAWALAMIGVWKN